MTDKISKLITEVIRRRRTEKGLSQEDLAKKVSVSPSAIRTWEQGKSCPTGDVLVKLLNVLDAVPDVFPTHEKDNSISVEKELGEIKKELIKTQKLLHQVLKRVEVDLPVEDMGRLYVIPKLHRAGWEHIQDSVKFIDPERAGKKGRQKIHHADYILAYPDERSPIAVIEMKELKSNLEAALEVAKKYASMLGLSFAFASNGYKTLMYDGISKEQTVINEFPSPQELEKRLNA